jgi:hypothetical protein
MPYDPEKAHVSWREFITPRKLTLFALSWISFCVCIILLAIGRTGSPLVLVLIGTGILFFCGLIGIIREVRARNSGS